MVIGLKRAGWSIRQIAADTHLGASTVHRLGRRWLEQGNVAIYRNVGATRVTSARVDRRILRQAVAAPQATCTAILQHVQDTLDHSISTRTISRRLVANGLHSCRPLRRLPLTPPNRRQRLEWCRARSTWMTEWHRVVFSDESRFCLSSVSRRVRVWRRRGERSNQAAIVERPTVRQRGIMVWGAIAYDSRSPLLRIQGTMTAQRYVDDVLRRVTLPYLQGVPNALYQQDNARPHTARITQQALQGVHMLPWPPYSPELSPIEHVWDIIGRRLHALPQPRSEDELWQMVEREWRAIPQDAIRTLIDSLPRRVAACIAVREDITFFGSSRKNQSFDDFVTKVKNKAVDCDFGDLTESLIRDRIVLGVLDKNLTERYLQDPDLTLSKAIALGRAAESSRTQLKEIKEEVTVNKLSSYKETYSNKNTEHKFVKKNHKFFKACGKCASKHEYGVGLLKNKQSILIKEEAIPQAYTARRFPLALREPVREELEKMSKLGVIKKINKPTEWSHPMVVVKKPNGDVRICIDPRKLNYWIKRERYMMPSPEEVLALIQKANIYTVLDAKYAFWQIPLTDEASLLTTMSTPYGRYCYTRMLYGLSSAPEIFQRIIHQLYLGVPNVVTYMDDVLIYSDSETEHLKILEQVLKIARENGLKFDKTKTQLMQPSVRYLGHIVSTEGIRPLESKVKSILDMLRPQDKKALQRFLGMVTYLAKFLPNLSDKTANMRLLLRKNEPWVWNDLRERDYRDLKLQLTSAPCLRHFDPKLDIEISTGASSNGLGAVLQQQGVPITYSSTALSAAQKKYSQIEKELLAVYFGCKRNHLYLYGRKFTAFTDHKPLLTIMKKPMVDLSPRLQHLVLQLQHYDFDLKYIPGKKPFWDIKEELFEWEGLLCRGVKLVIPEKRRNHILSLLHKAHRGINSTLSLARSTFYWPGMCQEVEEFVKKCRICQKYSRNNTKEPLIPHETGNYPFKKIGVDLFEIEGRKYLGIVDYYTKYPEMFELRSTKAEMVIEKLKEVFARFGVPEIMMTDNGPPFQSTEMMEFAKEWNVTHTTSRPRFPQSNGMIEQTIQTLKSTIIKCQQSKQDIYQALLLLRNTEHNSLPSPAIMLYGRKQRLFLPMKTTLMNESRICEDSIRKQHEANQSRMKFYFNRHARDLPSLENGQSVL
ncbi:K02A2.6-like, partial [Cordylochernes scorpioides]